MQIRFIRYRIRGRRNIYRNPLKLRSTHAPLNVDPREVCKYAQRAKTKTRHFIREHIKKRLRSSIRRGLIHFCRGRQISLSQILTFKFARRAAGNQEYANAGQVRSSNDMKSIGI
ncbi:hypothetical protein chiPu_0007386 [Chiloscyllium punctatum]|uniref:Uncharacterized protein n=1 Tax=Chiloscyllium punctatum TaxID=137246 RepID=A0A401SEZ3_CHIPU|nr:hypothetical protein [Chiloscyllium punctatum]